MRVLAGILSGLVRVVMLPIRVGLAVAGLALAGVGLVLRLGMGLVTAPMRIAVGAVRLVGPVGLALGAVGLVVGLLVAPVPGAELRRRLRALAGDVVPSDESVREAVRSELATSAPTWHLDQPDVSVVAGRVVLDGRAEHPEGAAALAAVAATVPGVVDVESRMVVAT